MNANPISFDWQSDDPIVLKHNSKTLVRFLRHCKRDANGVLYWDAACNASGYGIVGFGSGSVLAHRLAYALLVGDVPSQTCVLHHNDAPSCVDPRMLYLGSYKDNAGDRERRRRGNHARGERQGSARLNARKVIEIRHRFGEGELTMEELGDEYGVSSSCVNRIIQGETWKHV